MVLFPYLGILGGPVRHGVHGSILQVRGTYSPGEIWGHFGTIVTSGSKGSYPTKKTVKKGDIVPFWRPPPLNGSKGDICRLITEKSA